MISNKKCTSREFIEKSKKIFGDLYDYSKVEYKNNKTKVQLLCTEHGYFFVRPDTHLTRKAACQKCAKIRTGNLNKNENWLNDFKSVHGDRYDYSKVNYINNKIKVEIICKEHDSFFMKPNAHTTQKQGCPKCSRKYNNTDSFISVSKNIHNNKFDYSKVFYTNSHDKVEIICKKHKSFFIRPCDHINHKQGCPKCSMSKGEMKIMGYFDRLNIDYNHNYSFDDCRDKLTLPFDFYIPEYNLCIEFDGEQHYRPIKWFGGDKNFKSQKKRDYIKDMYCLDNKISLIRISYLEYDKIFEILDSIFNI
jgi:hypothetical protein